MPWEYRNGCGPYYFRARRVGGRIVKTYIGGGLAGQLAELQDQEARADRYKKADRQRRELAFIDSQARQVQAFCDLTDAILRAVLALAGVYQHKRGDWRRQREEPHTP